jgi:O-antigen ligase
LLFFALPPRGRWILGGALVSLAVVLRLLLFSKGATNPANWLFGGALGTDPTFSLNSLQGRLELWSRAIYGIQDFPFTGMGMNTFRKLVHMRYPLFLTSPNVDIAHAHNEFLQAALDLGIPGLIAFIAIYLGGFWMLPATCILHPVPCNL